MAERAPGRDDRQASLLRAPRVRVHVWTLAASLGGLPFAAASFFSTGALPEDELLSFFAIGLSFGAIAWVTFFHSVREALLPVRALEKGQAGQEALVRGARAAIQAPGRVRTAAALHLGGALIACLVGWSVFVPGFGALTVLRVAITGGCAVAVAAYLVELTAQTTCRRVLEAVIAAGLSVESARGLSGAFTGSLRRSLMKLVSIFSLVGATLISHAELVRPGGAGFGTGPWILIALIALTAGGAAWLTGQSLSVPMREMSARAERLTQRQLAEGSLLAGDRDVFMMSVASVRLERQLGDAVRKLAAASERLSSTSGGLVATLGGQEDGAAEQAAALNETSATTEELARSAGHIAENAGEVASVAERTVGAAQSGQRSSEAFFNAMIGMRTQNQRVADAVVRLNKRVQQIGKIVEFIHDLADKSDLLALNAELEGTKAGDVGRGFSLVAAEMRRMAEDVLRSTREIEKLITDIRDATHAAVMSTEAGVKATEGGTSAANEVMERLRLILDHARETSDSVRSISMATQQQQSGTSQLAEAMADILRGTEEGAVATQQLHGANVDLSGLAESLRAVVLRFELKGADAS